MTGYASLYLSHSQVTLLALDAFASIFMVPLIILRSIVMLDSKIYRPGNFKIHDRLLVMLTGRNQYLEPTFL